MFKYQLLLEDGTAGPFQPEEVGASRLDFFGLSFP